MNRKTAVQDACRDAKVRIETEFKIDKNYDYENKHEKFCSTATDEKADELGEGRARMHGHTENIERNRIGRGSQ